MKAKVMVGVILLTIGMLLAAAELSRTGAQEIQSKDFKLSGPYTHKNLTIYLIHGPDQIKGKRWLTLQEALVQKKVVVYETKSVNELAIQNFSEEDVYVQSGEIVKGGQQDRMLSVDIILPPHSKRIPISAFCVEHGRWTQRGQEKVTVFASSTDAAASKEMKLAAKIANSQGEVWKNVAAAQDRLSENVGTRVNSTESESSFQLAVENKEVQATAESYTKSLSRIVDNSSDVIGYVFAINGKVNSSDVYASNVLFKKLWPKLLKASAIEAIAALSDDRSSEPVTKDEVRKFLSSSEDAKADEKDVTPRTSLVKRETSEDVFFETRDKASKSGWVHRNYIKKQ